MRETSKLKETFDMIWQETVEILPTLLFGLLILTSGWLIAKLLSKLVQRILKSSKNSKIANLLNIDELSKKLNLSIDLSEIISRVIYWVILLIAIVAAADSVGLTSVSEQLSGIISYLPKVLSAILIFIIGYTLARFLKNSVKSITQSMGMAIGGILSEVLFYFLLVIITLTSLSQAGLDITVISSQLYIVLGTLALILSISVGFGSQKIVTDIIKTHYNRGNIEVGDILEVNGIRGKVVVISRTSVVLETETEKHIFPCDTFYSSYYKIIK